MNKAEIRFAVDRHRNHPVLGKASKFLERFMDLMDQRSDGWCYWKRPVMAARRLMMMLESPEEATEALFRKCLVPIKVFCTRNNFPFPDENYLAMKELQKLGGPSADLRR